MSFKSTQEVIDVMSNFEGLYDFIRIVDPVRKIIISDEETNEINNSIHCYDFWQKGMSCENCISYRALNENNTFMKVRFRNEEIYLVTSSPVKINDKKYVMEMLKNITKLNIVPNIYEKNASEIEEIIDDLNSKAITDELTNVYNRRHLNEMLPIDMNFALSNKTMLSIILMDLDYFKQINDVYGHIAGDLILKEISKIMKSSIRKGFDWAARYGGDEFLISLPGADSAAAHRIAEVVRKRIEKTEITFQGNKINITVSMGVYTMDSEEISFEELIKRADKNMYEAKNRGRNTVV
ncbi:MAG: GGDEF domain-containing protein [Sedimentibacter sp.]|uniref:GGDEF domain-containing protein n=1 Tax=Sedimentibacter sp. TaxID=1960295 RepID=UPI002981F9E2|nr:GGDEF domain-containing protein [Sedimentibacter sp.]MDW5300679.1 GGDEF domain-containing protein [Sedimentibacter sp.]